jgi:regulatory protein
MEQHEVRAGQLKQGYLYAVRLLAASKKSSHELAKRLEGKGYPVDVTQEIIDRLKAQKLLSDGKLVADTILRATESKGYGRNRIALELKKRGIARTTIHDALDQLPKAKEREVALNLAQLRWQKLGGIDARKKQQRLYAYLVNRGFDFDLCREIVDQLKGVGVENRTN